MKKLLLIALFFVFKITLSQIGSLEGKVLEKSSNSPLIGVNITIKNLSDTSSNSIRNQLYNILGTATNLQGEFKINNLLSGNYEVSVSYIGYEKQVHQIEIKDDKSTYETFLLESSNTEIDVVVVSAGKFEQKLEEVTVSMDIIKTDLIENKNTVDLGVLMNQSPGVQVVDGQANIRAGSGWSYNTGSRVLVMIDDMPLLSGDRGTVEWNMIPMENISQIEVIKGASSVLFGSSALNGVINVRTAYPKGDDPEVNLSFFSGFYDKPSREGLHWWGDEARQFTGSSFSYAQYKNNTGIILGGNIYTNDGYKGGYVTDSTSSRFGQILPVSEKWARFNFNIERNPIEYPGLTIGVNGNIMYLHQYESLIFASDSIGFTPIGVPEGDTPALWTQVMYTIDPHIKYINPNNNTRHSLKSRFFKDDYKPFDEEEGYSTVFYNEYQFQKTWKMKYGHIVSTSGLTSSYIKGDYDAVYGGGGISPTKEMFNYSAYSQLDLKYKRLNLSLGARVEQLHFQDEIFTIPVLRSGFNYRLFQTTFLRGSIGQGYRYPTIMESFVKTDYHPVYVYPNPDLTAEYGWSAELGLKQVIKIGEWQGMLDFAGFIMHYHDMIEFTFGQWDLPNPDDPLSNFFGIGFKCVNIGETRITGFETSLIGEGTIGEIGVNLLASYTFAKPVIINPNETYYEYINAEGDLVSINYNTYDDNEFLDDEGTILNPNYNPTGASYNNSGDILKYRHEHLVKFDINLEYPNGISTGLSTRYNSAMQNMDAVFSYGLFNEVGGTNDAPVIFDLGIVQSNNRFLNGDLIFDWRIGKKVSDKMTLSLIIDNILNREYINRVADLGAPRTISLKLKIKS
ncbi:MAG: hypothetical protein CMD26_04805 [Flavobacteriales bacterium]|nr:hypothetical protein [Flavobacteriales bacterium]